MRKILLQDRINENRVLETKSRGFFFFFPHFPLSFVIAFKDDELAAFRNATFTIYFVAAISKLLLVDRDFEKGTDSSLDNFFFFQKGNFK